MLSIRRFITVLNSLTLITRRSNAFNLSTYVYHDLASESYSSVSLHEFGTGHFHVKILQCLNGVVINEVQIK
jgi:hypothetical protein